MRANEFITENIEPAEFIELVHSAKKYLTQMFTKGIADRSAVQSVISVLVQRGIDHQQAANAAKKAFTDIKGADVTTEGLFDI